MHCQSDFYIKNSDDVWCYCCFIVPPAITSTPTDAVVYTTDPYTVQCHVTGVPTPEISYYFNATLITTGVSNGILTIASVSHANTGPYQCFANNVRNTSSALWVVTVRDPGEYNVCGNTASGIIHVVQPPHKKDTSKIDLFRSICSHHRPMGENIRINSKMNPNIGPVLKYFSRAIYIHV